VEQGVEFNLFWTVNGTKLDVTNDPKFSVKFVDRDDNGIDDQIHWVVPQLSEQEFDVEADIVIINVQSYPTVGGNWTVNFTTVGTADLIITGINGTTFGEAAPDDLKFLELNNGTHTLSPIIQGNSIIYYDYSSTEQGFEVSKVLTSGKHHLEFKFGNNTAYAHNDATASTVVFVSRTENSALNSGTSVTFQHTVSDNLSGLLVVTVATREEGTGGIPNVSQVTFDGVTMDLAKDNTLTQGDLNLEIYTLLEVDGLNEITNADVVISLNVGGQIASTASSFTGVDQTQNFLTAASEAQAGTAVVITPTVVAANSKSVVFTAIASERSANGINTCTGSVTPTEQSDFFVNDGTDDLHTAVCRVEVTSAGSFVTTFTLTAGDTNLLSLGIEIEGGVIDDDSIPTHSSTATISASLAASTTPPTHSSTATISASLAATTTQPTHSSSAAVILTPSTTPTQCKSSSIHNTTNSLIYSCCKYCRFIYTNSLV